MVVRPQSTAAFRRASDTHAGPWPMARDVALESWIAGDRIAILFQPQFDMAGARVVGVEALARAPGEEDATRLFARAASAGLAHRLSRHIQRAALRAVAAWPEKLTTLPVSINVLPEDVATGGFDIWLLDELRERGIDPARLTIEIIESDALDNRPTAIACLHRLKAAGVRIAIDDFGTGFASLAYLAALPLDIIKVDRGLIADIEHSERARIVVTAILRLGSELGLQTLVEGVERESQRAMLASWGCEYFQGFLGAPALDSAALRALVETRQEIAA